MHAAGGFRIVSDRCPIATGEIVGSSPASAIWDAAIRIAETLPIGDQQLWWDGPTITYNVMRIRAVPVELESPVIAATAP